MFDVLSQTFLEHGYLAVFLVLLLCGLGFPIPEELALVAAGVVAYEGRAHLGWMVAVTIAGILIGDSMLFYLGRRYGPTLLRKRLFSRLLHVERMSKVRDQFDRHGPKAVFFARFLAGIRAPVYFTAGTLGMRYRVFLLLDLLGALLFAPVLVWLGLHFGEHIGRLLLWIIKFDRVLLGVVLCVAAWYFGRRALRRRRRRRAAGGAAQQD